MKLTCYPTSGAPPRIRPAPARRAWMDATPNGFANRCLPLRIANEHGWEVLSTCDVLVAWNGGVGLDALQIKVLGGDARLAPISHFGSGILTFNIDGLFRTEPGVSFWVTGPVNSPKDAIYALSGVVETDWATATFTVNWVMTRPMTIVRFQIDEPICHVFPIQLDMIEQVQPEFRPMASNPELAQDMAAWAASRDKFNADLKVEGSEAQKQRWQGEYFRAESTSCPGKRMPGHRTKLRLNSFKGST